MPPGPRGTSGGVRAETVTAIAATVTAIAALFVAVWDNVQTREYNRVSVQPHLVLEFSKHQGDDANEGRLVLRNEGIGPAVIDRIAIELAGPDGARNEYSSWNEARDAIRRDTLLVTGYSDLREGTVLGIERAMDLLEVEQIEPAAGDRVQALINRMSVRIVYSSVWGETYEAGWPEP